MAEEVIKKYTIISGAPDDDLEFIRNSIDMNSYIIAADSGYIKCEKLKISPDIIIGDYDSSDVPEISTGADVIRLKVEKAHTDTFAAVINAVEQGCSEIEIFGAIGSRVDHTYSNILCLDYCLKHCVKCTILNNNNRISLIDGEGFVNHDFQWFSLFAFMGDCEGVRIEGAHYTAGFYDTDALDFKISDQFGQSNYVEGDLAHITCEKGVLLLIESND